MLSQCTVVLPVFILSFILNLRPAEAAVWPKARPKLVVVVVIDQFRADYLSRFESQFSADGFRALISEGAYFPYGEYDIMQSMTGPGHATVLTGSYPYQMGIPLNDWYDQNLHAVQYCVEDAAQVTVGAPMRPHVGTSPKNLVGTTLGDELKNAGLKTRSVSIALKDRAAILMGGHRADLALWQDGDSKKWVSSRYYVKTGELPSWVQKLNQNELTSTCHAEEPCGAIITEQAFEEALKNENLGNRGDDVDLISVSFSGHDYAGHKFGPNSPEIEKVTMTEDQMLAKMRKAVAAQVKGGLKNVVFVLTGDHGVAPTPEYLKDTGIETGRIDEEQLTLDMEAALNLKCPSKKTGSWIGFVEDFNFFLNEEKASGAKCSLTVIEDEMKAQLLKHPEFAFVMTRDEYEHHSLPPLMFGRQVLKTFYPGRSGHVIGMQKPFYINVSHNRATHMTGYTYDRTVPILFAGFGIQTGLYASKAEVVDIAPTLAFLLGVLPPALNEGHVLTSALKGQSRSAHDN